MGYPHLTPSFTSSELMFPGEVSGPLNLFLVPALWTAPSQAPPRRPPVAPWVPHLHREGQAVLWRGLQP